MGFFLLFNYESAEASDYVFYCKPWEDQISKISMEDNFSIELKNETLTILGGDQNSKFATLIFTHPNFYLFASPTGSLINLSRNDGPKKLGIGRPMKAKIFSIPQSVIIKENEFS